MSSQAVRGKFDGDGAHEPGLHDAVHADPIRRIGGREVGEDMALQRVLADSEEEGLPPPLVESRGHVEDKRYQGANVFHHAN